MILFDYVLNIFSSKFIKTRQPQKYKIMHPFRLGAIVILKPEYQVLHRWNIGQRYVVCAYENEFIFLYKLGVHNMQKIRELPDRLIEEYGVFAYYLL
jgi:hypothetical protein